MMNSISMLGLHILLLLGLTQKSFSTERYETLLLENNKVCSLHLIKNGAIVNTISARPEGLVVKETSYFDNISNSRKNFSCHFEVETSSKNQFPGLFVVIQNLNLRQDPNTGECIDYVGIRPIDSNPFTEITNINWNLKSNKYKWTKFCGDLRAKRDGSSDESENNNSLSRAGFLTNNTGVEVEIFVKSPTQPTDQLQLEIFFTPYLACKNSWSDYRECGWGKCIKKHMFSDNIVNCPFLDCPDEGGCDAKDVVDELPRDLRTKVTLTAVTSIFCSFFLFLGLVWCCKYFEILCWSASTLLGRPNPVELSPMAPPTPPAPTQDPAHSKDLPPSYETLFPDR